MKGDIYTDFIVATILFVFAFLSLFYYLNSEFSLKTQYEKEKSANLEIQNIFDSLPRETVEKRIILANGHSTNEFIDISGYDVDLIIDENGNSICFDLNKKGFAADVSNSRFYLYSTNAATEKNICDIHGFNNDINEKISSPIYEEFLVDMPKVNSAGAFCAVKHILIFSGFGIKEEEIKICV